MLVAAVGQLLAYEIGDEQLKVVAGSILATAVVIFALVMGESKPWIRLPLALFGLAITAWAIFLFTKGEEKKAEVSGTTAVNACKGTLSTLDSLIRAKLANVGNADAARSIAGEMQGVIERSPCKPG